MRVDQASERLKRVTDQTHAEDLRRCVGRCLSEYGLAPLTELALAKVAMVLEDLIARPRILIRLDPKTHLLPEDLHRGHELLLELAGEAAGRKARNHIDVALAHLELALGEVEKEAPHA